MHLTENEIDGEAFLLLSDQDLKDLVPLYGPRAKLNKKRKEANEATRLNQTNCSSAAGSCLSRCESTPIPELEELLNTEDDDITCSFDVSTVHKVEYVVASRFTSS